MNNQLSVNFKNLREGVRINLESPFKAVDKKSSMAPHNYIVNFSDI